MKIGYEKNNLGLQYCKEWGCMNIGEDRFNGFCEECFEEYFEEFKQRFGRLKDE